MSLCEVDTVKIEKEKAMQRYRRFKKIANVARTLQFCFAFLFFSWIISRSSAYFPAAVELCRCLFNRLCMLVVNHHFGFLLGNLIIITLLVKSGHSACHNRISSAVAGNTDDHDDFLISQFLPAHETVFCDITTEEEVFDKKHIAKADSEVPSPVDGEHLAVPITEAEPRKYRRTRSEEFESKVTEKIQLRRSETERRQGMDSSGKDSAEVRRTQVEDLSNEEFQRKVEAFIERQQRFLREESLSMALSNRCHA